MSPPCCDARGGSDPNADGRPLAPRITLTPFDVKTPKMDFNTWPPEGLMGAGAVLVQWGHIAPKTGADRNTLSLGYSHALSKRTDAYVAAMHDKVDGLSSGGGYSVGLRHRF